MNFKNPWGQGHTRFDRWIQNDWSEGGKYYEILRKLPPSPEEPEFEVPVIRTISSYDLPNELTDDYEGEETLLRLANITIPFLLLTDLQQAMSTLKEKTLSFAVFDQFDLNVKKRFAVDKEVVTEKDYDSKDHYLIAYSVMAALLTGIDTQVHHETNDVGEVVQPNVLRKNYDIKTETGITGYPKAVNYPTALYQPEYQPTGILIRTADYLRVTFWINEDLTRNLTVRLNIGEITESQ